MSATAAAANGNINHRNSVLINSTKVEQHLKWNDTTATAVPPTMSPIDKGQGNKFAAWSIKVSLHLSSNSQHIFVGNQAS